MDKEEIKKTELWELYEKGIDFLNMHEVFTDTDKNYRMYNGNQWEGANLGGIEQAQYNFIETVVNYKVSTINQNLWAVHFNSENYENRAFRKTAEKTCDMLDRKAANVWEKDQMDIKIRKVSDDAAINDEGIMYVDYNEDTQSPVNEIINKNDIQYGNEMDEDIQNQPYIIISKRVPVSEAREYAERKGVKKKDLALIIGDKQTREQAGEDAKREKDDMCTIVTKMYKDNGEVHYSQGTMQVDIVKDENTKLHLYPIAHFNWKSKKGWARGEGEVRWLIPNQLELNKTLARMLLSVKQCSYPQKIANLEKISNPEALDQLGGIVKTKNGATVDDVNKIFSYVQPASMSTDVSKVLNDLIQITRDLKNAGDIATGQINPEQASGKAILAVQQASQQPLVKQLTGLKTFIEDLARIWMDMWNTYTPEGMKLEEEITDSITGEKYIKVVDIPASVLEKLKGVVKIDITPESAYDKFAREQTLENFLQAGYFSPQRIGELRMYAEALPDDSTTPKQALLDICDKVEAEQEKIAMINAQAQLMQQRANQFLSGTPETQASMIDDAININNQATA
jgi:hypothetical protein